MATIEIRNDNADFLKLRELIDQGFQNSSITEYAANQFGLKRERASVIISRIGRTTKKYKGQAPITIRQRWSNYEIGTTSLIIDTITKRLPPSTLVKDIHIGLTGADLTTKPRVMMVIWIEDQSNSGNREK